MAIYLLGEDHTNRDNKREVAAFIRLLSPRPKYVLLEGIHADMEADKPVDVNVPFTLREVLTEYGLDYISADVDEGNCIDDLYDKPLYHLEQPDFHSIQAYLETTLRNQKEQTKLMIRNSSREERMDLLSKHYTYEQNVFDALRLVRSFYQSRATDMFQGATADVVFHAARDVGALVRGLNRQDGEAAMGRTIVHYAKEEPFGDIVVNMGELHVFGPEMIHELEAVNTQVFRVPLSKQDENLDRIAGYMYARGLEARGIDLT